MTGPEARAEVVILRVEKDKLLTAWASAKEAAEKSDALLCARLKRSVKVETEMLEIAKNWTKQQTHPLVYKRWPEKLTEWARLLGVPVPKMEVVSHERLPIPTD